VEKDNHTYTNPAEFLDLLPFVQTLGIRIVDARPGAVTVEMPFSDAYSTPPNHFPASIVGTVGDVAAVASCLSAVPAGWATATLDYTIKMTGPATGEALRAEGRVLQAGRTTSVGTADIFAVSGTDRTHCGTLLATARNFPLQKGA